MRALELEVHDKDLFLTKDDKVDIIKSVYLVNIIQFLATIASLVAIVKLMLK